MPMKQLITNTLKESYDLKQLLLTKPSFIEDIEKAILLIKNCLKNSGTVITCGNGGSACDAMHFTEELLARYKKERPGMRSRHLLDVGTITCWANDYNFDQVFSRQIETIARTEDLLVVFSTSGNSTNIINALKAAKQTKTPSLSLLGNNGGEAKNLSEHFIIVPSNSTARIQEIHILLVHIFCEALEA